MADRYWVGGTANWDGTAGTKWATTSGGAGGAAVPTNSDNVFLDAASGTVTVTIATVGALCADLNCAGFTGTLAGTQTINIRGSLFYSTTMTRTRTGTVTFSATTTGKTITTNGKGIGGNITQFNGSGAWTLQDDFSCGSISFLAGILDTNGKAVSISTAAFTSTGAGTRTLTLGATVLTSSANGGINFAGATNMTLNSGTSKIVLTSTSPNFSGNGFTYYDVEIAGVIGGGTATVSGNNTFNSFIISRTAAFTLKFTDGSTQLMTNWVGGGTAGNVMTLTNTASTTQATLTKTGGGAATIDYADISWINATPSFTWSATNSTDGGNNTGFNFGGGFGNNGLFFGSNF